MVYAPLVLLAVLEPAAVLNALLESIPHRWALRCAKFVRLGGLVLDHLLPVRVLGIVLKVAMAILVLLPQCALARAQPVLLAYAEVTAPRIVLASAQLGASPRRGRRFVFCVQRESSVLPLLRRGAVIAQGASSRKVVAQEPSATNAGGDRSVHQRLQSAPLAEQAPFKHRREQLLVRNAQRVDSAMGLRNRPSALHAQLENLLTG